MVDSNQRKINYLKSLHSTPWRHDKQAMTTFYKTFIRAAMEYASEVWSSAALTNLKKVDTLQSNALRIITGAHRSTPIRVLEADTMCSSLHDRRQKQLISTLHRARCLPASSPLFKRFATSPIYQRFATSQEKSKSFFMRAADAHRALFHEDPDLESAIPFPPLIPPWAPHYLPPKPKPTTSLTLLNKITLKKIRERQEKEFKTHKHTEVYRRYRPTVTPQWKSADLKKLRADCDTLKATIRAFPPLRS